MFQKDPSVVMPSIPPLPSPPLGVGIDIIEISRIRQALERHGRRFLERIFCSEELDYCLGRKDPAPHLAARWAAKEALVKSLGTGFGKEVRFQDLCIQRSSSGKPIVQASARFQERFGPPSFMVSMSHSSTMAVALAFYLGDSIETK